MTSVLERVRRQGPAADLHEPERPTVPVDRVVDSIRRAGAATDPGEARAAFEEAAWIEGLEALDEVLARVTPGGLVAGLTGRRRRTRELARQVLGTTESAAAVRLAAALLGAVGDRSDAGVLEELAVHPDLAHHAATALAVLGLSHRHAVGALLRVMNRVRGEQRVLVIDRLLAFVREPSVRLALVRDALDGLAPEHAGEVADAIYEGCRVEQALHDPDAPEDVRAGARLVMAHRRGG